MSIKKRIREIKEEQIAKQEKRALIVEGPDDVSALMILLNNHYPQWEKQWVIAEAGNKRSVQTILRKEPNWLGLVDRDEWDQNKINQQTEELPNLLVLPRFCIENYLINPTEIWRAIPANRQAMIDGGEAAFSEAILSELPTYRRHGVLWSVVTPLWSGLRALGFKEALAADSRECVQTAQNDETIKNILSEWDELLDPNRIFNAFTDQLHEVQALSEDEQLALFIHGKTFWKQVIYPYLISLSGQLTESKLQTELFKRLSWPEDLNTLVERLKS